MKGSFNLTKLASNNSDVFNDQKHFEKNPRVFGPEELLESDELKVVVAFLSKVNNNEHREKEMLSNCPVYLTYCVLGSDLNPGETDHETNWANSKAMVKPIEESLQKASIPGSDNYRRTIRLLCKDATN